MSDIQIAQEASRVPIQKIGTELGIPIKYLSPFDHDKTETLEKFIGAQKGKNDRKPVLVPAVHPMPAPASVYVNDEGRIDGLF